MKRLFALSFAMLFLCACSGKEAPEPQRPCSLEELGYCIDLQQVPEPLRQDTFLGDEKLHSLPSLQNRSYSTLEFTVYGVLDAEPSIAFLLQGVPAGTEELWVGDEVLPIESWDSYRVFQNEDILVFDLYPLYIDAEQTLPQQLRQQNEANSARLQQRLDELMEGVLEDESQWRDLSFGLTDTRGDSRYLDYLWAYYHDNIGELIVPLE